MDAMRESNLRITLDPIRFRARSGGLESEELTAVEYRILSLFLKYKMKPLPKDRMMSEIWGNSRIEKKTVNVHLSHLRKKLHSMGFTISHVERSVFCIEPLVQNGAIEERVNVAS
jgi:DNA-binding response OmpR family regulator